MKLSTTATTCLLPALPAIASGAVRTTNVSPQMGIDYGILKVPSGCATNEARGRALLSQEFANQLLSNADLPPASPAEGNIIQTRFLTETVHIHTDHFPESNLPVRKGSSVAFIPVNDNNNAYFTYGNERVPLVKDQMYHFDGSVEHGIIIESGNLELLGPFDLPSFKMVLAPPVPVPACSERDPGECCTAGAVNTCKLCAVSSDDTRRRLSSKSTKSPKGSSTSSSDDSGATCGVVCVDDAATGLEPCYNCIVGQPNFYDFIPGALEDVTTDPARLAEIVSDLDGNMEGNFGIVQDLLPLHELSNLRNHADSALENLVAFVDEAEAEKMLEDFRFDISPSELSSLISPESIQNLYSAFKDYAEEFSITQILMRRTDLNGDKHIQYHSDVATAVMHIWLNEDGAEGGNLVYLNKDGATKIETKPGAAALHKNGIVHGITPLNGTRYILVLVADIKDQEDVLASMIA